MLDQIKAFFSDAPHLKAARQAQREATLDLVVWMMYADNKIALPENEQLEALEITTDWESVTPVHQYVNTSIARIRTARESVEASNELLQDIYKRLGDPATRKEAYDAAERLAAADGEVADAEQAFLNRVRGMFSLD